MHATVEKYGMLAGKDLCRVTLTNDNRLRVDLLNYGAAIEKVMAPDKTGQLKDIVLTLADVADYSTPNEHVYLGKTVGRVAGRIRGGQWQAGTLRRQLALNDGQNQMHSGAHGLDSIAFTLQVFRDDHVAGVTFRTVEWAHDGFPGDVAVQVTYTLDNANNLRYEISGRTDDVTLFNPTNHVFWALAGPQTTVDDDQLMINSDYYLPLDQESIPAQGMKAVTGSVYDFRHAKVIGDVLNSADAEVRQENGLNHPFLFTDQPRVVLTDPQTGRRLTLTTSASAVIVYSANRFDNHGIYRGIYCHGGLALECQAAPSGDGDLSAITLFPGEVRRAWTNWQFNVEP